jgi:hypothetical protein
LCEGGLRRHAKRSQKTLNDHITNGSTEYSSKPLRGGDRSWGKDSFLPPNSWRPSTRSQARSARIRAYPSNLGARSPSGNTRGGCRGFISFRQGLPLAKEIAETILWYDVFVFLSAPNFAKRNGWSKRRIPPQTPPPPLAKSEDSRGFAETISPEKCFRKTESFLLVRIRVLFVIGSDFVNDTPPD